MVKSKNKKHFSRVNGKKDASTTSIKNATTLFINNMKMKWYEIPMEIPRDELVTEIDNDLVFTLSQEAEKLLQHDSTIYNDKRARDRRSDHRWMQTVMTKGTSADKVAAHTVQVQDSPVHSLSILRNLVAMVKVEKKKECTLAKDTLCELWQSDLLYPGEKLVAFESRPLGRLAQLNSHARSQCLILWWFESCLKELYLTFVRALDALAREDVDAGREKAIAAMCSLLSENPELEQMLLSQVVNKLGDPQQKVASKAIYCLTQVLDKHPNMQGVVLEEVEKMLFRPNVGHKAQYYAICFLTQFKLHTDFKELAVNLIKVYFCFFKACIKKGELDSRMLGVLLMGVNRAFPYARDSLGSELSEHLDTMHRLVHVSPFNIALHTLCLLHQVSETSSIVGDRFYTALYKKLLDPALLSTAHHAAFLNLLYKAMSSDSQLPRLQAFIKRVLQVACYSPAPLACGLLYLVSQVISHSKYELHASQLLPSATVKLEYPTPDEEEGDGEEKFSDVKLEDEATSSKTPKEEEEEPKPAVLGGWVHRVQSSTRISGPKAKVAGKARYDPLHRNPLFSHAHTAAHTELSTLSRHHHPTVSLFASNLLAGEPIKYTGDPLQDFTVSRFLDRFVFKNPKKLEEGGVFSRQYRPSGLKSLSVTSSSYLNEEEHRIPCEEVYLYRYLRKKQQPWLAAPEEETKSRPAKKKDGEESDENDDEEDVSDADSVASEEFERLLHSGGLGGSSGSAIDPDFADDIGGDLSADSDNDSLDGNHTGKKNKKSKGKKRRLEESYEEEEDDDDDRGMPSIFAAAEEFADILEDTGGSTLDVAGSSGVSNTDNAAVKQLNWEAARDRWVRGPDRRRGTAGKRPIKKQKGSFKNSFNRKR